MLRNGIMIGSQAVVYQIDDLVAVHKGQGLLAIALVKGERKAVPEVFDVVNVEEEYGITQEHHPYYFSARFRKVLPVMNGAGRIRKKVRQQVIQDLWNVLDN